MKDSVICKGDDFSVDAVARLFQTTAPIVEEAIRNSEVAFHARDGVIFLRGETLGLHDFQDWVNACRIHSETGCWPEDAAENALRIEAVSRAELADLNWLR